MSALLLLIGVGILLMLSRNNRLLFRLSWVGLVAALGLTVFEWRAMLELPMLRFDHPALGFGSLALFLTLLIFLLLRKSEHRNEYAALMAFSVVGGLLMVSYDHLVILFLGIEILSLPLYVLAGSARHNASSNESALKYFVMGSFASGILLLGMALLYAGSGQLYLSGMTHPTLPALFYGGFLLVTVGFLFKIGAVPFHFWVPDVYEGAPTIFTSYMATVVKVFAVGSFARFFVSGIALPHGPLMWGMVVLTMTLGNLMALRQTAVKRMLAYSSIAHAGFLLMVLMVSAKSVWPLLLFYSAAYSLASLAAFAVVKLSERVEGLFQANRLLGVVFVISLMSLAGIPPLAGFFAKYFVLFGALRQGYFALTAIALINTLLAVYYYFKWIQASFAKTNVKHLELSKPARAVLLLLTGLTVLVGFSSFWLVPVLSN